MGHLDKVTQQNATMVEQTTSASQLLDKEANSLARIISRFTVGHGEASGIPDRTDGTGRHEPSTLPLRRAG
jgi:methyl-accepting chemotaxis protein